MGGIKIIRDHPIISNPLKMLTLSHIHPFLSIKSFSQKILRPAEYYSARKKKKYLNKLSMKAREG